MGDGATAVLVKELEGGFQFLLTDQVSLIHGRHHKLSVVYRAVSINVDGLEHFINLFICHLNSKVFLITLQHLLLIKCAISIFVHKFEDLL